MRTNVKQGAFSVLEIEIDGHFHGSPNAPRPWVAQILGSDPKYGLEREFLRPMNDWEHAHKAWSGNIYGRIARFHLRDGNLYEVCRLRGNSSRRHLAREFLLVQGRKKTRVQPTDVLDRVFGSGLTFKIPEDKSGDSWVSHVKGLGTPTKLGFLVDGDERLYRLKEGLYEVMQSGSPHFVGVRDGQAQRLSQQEALAWL